MKPQPISYLLNEMEHICWSLDLENGMHSIWDLLDKWSSRCKGNGFFEVGQAGGHVGINFRSGLENLISFPGGLPLPRKFLWGGGGALCYIVHSIILTLSVRPLSDSTYGNLNLEIPSTG